MALPRLGTCPDSEGLCKLGRQHAVVACVLCSIILHVAVVLLYL